MNPATDAVSWTFTASCPCGATFQVVDGVAQPHECRPITVQALRNAWAAGYDLAKQELAER